MATDAPKNNIFDRTDLGSRIEWRIKEKNKT